MKQPINSPRSAVIFFWWVGGELLEKAVAKLRRFPLKGGLDTAVPQNSCYYPGTSSCTDKRGEGG